MKPPSTDGQHASDSDSDEDDEQQPEQEALVFFLPKDALHLAGVSEDNAPKKLSVVCMLLQLHACYDLRP